MSAKVVILTGGVGGAKLVHGLAMTMPPENLTAIINTGDDFTHLGLPICPDFDTLLYTLSGKANAAQGWGRADESWNFMQALRSLYGPGWFNLGDGDLALHVMRLAGQAEGLTKTELALRFSKSWGVDVKMLPATDDLLATMIDTENGTLDFQSYFVRQQCHPKVKRIWFEQAETATPTAKVSAAINDADIIFIAPSNPWLSIDPILAINGMRETLTAAKAPIIAISPLVDGKAVKGPTAKIMEELGLELSHAAILDHYAPLLDGIVTDSPIKGSNYANLVTNTLMSSDNDRKRLAAEVLAFARRV